MYSQPKHHSMNVRKTLCNKELYSNELLVNCRFEKVVCFMGCKLQQCTLYGGAIIDCELDQCVVVDGDVTSCELSYCKISSSN